MSTPTPTSSTRGRRRTLLQNQFALISSIVKDEGRKQMKAKGTDNGESALTIFDHALRINEGNQQAEPQESQQPSTGEDVRNSQGQESSVELLQSMIEQTLRINGGNRQAEPKESQQPATEEEANRSKSQETSVKLLQSLRSKLSATVGSEGSVKTYTFKELQAAFNQDWRKTPLEAYATQLGYKTVRRMLKGDEVAEIISREVGPDGKSRLRAKGTDKSERVLSMIEQTLRINGGNRQAEPKESQQPATEEEANWSESQEASVKLLQSLRSKLSATVGSEGSVKTYTFKELQAAFNQDWRKTPLEAYATQLGYKTVRRMLKGDEVAEIISREVGPDGKSRLRAKGTDKSERVLSMIDQTLRINEARRQARQRESQQRVQAFSRSRRTQ